MAEIVAKVQLITCSIEANVDVNVAQRTFRIPDGHPDCYPMVRLGQDPRLPPARSWERPQDVSTFLFWNKHRSDMAVGRLNQIVPLLLLYYSVDQDSGYSDMMYHTAH